MNLKTLIQILDIANKARTHLRVIQITIEIVRQLDRSLAKSDGQSNETGPRSSGFVYVIRDKSNGERFKTGYRAKPPWRDSQLRSEMGESGDFVLVIPAKNAKTLETRLRSSYARGSRRGAWFTLSDEKRREILIIAAVVQVFANDDLGMANIDQETVQVATDLLNQLQALGIALWDKRRRTRQPNNQELVISEIEPNLDNLSAIPDIVWNWESVLEDDYRALPKLKGKEAYISIIRDNEAKQGKIFFDNHPVKSIETAFLERSLRFPLEVILVLKVDNRKKARVELLSPSERKEGTDWVGLSDEELGEIRQSAKEEYTHGSVYVSPKTHWQLETLSNNDYKDCPKLEDPAGYVCVIQGVKPGSRYKIWRSEHPKDSGGLFGMPGQLNNPHDALHSPKPVKFKCIIRSEYAKPFESFLKERYNGFKSKGDWFKLDDWYKLEDAQLDEIRKLGI